MHWVAYKTENYFDSYGCSPPNNLIKFIIKRIGYCLFSDYETQGLTTEKDYHYSIYCFYIIYLTKVEGLDFISVVSNLYYQVV